MKRLVGMVIAAVLTVAGTGTAMAAWNQNATGWWYQYTDGSYPSSSFKDIDGARYYFDDVGYMKIGWQNIKGTWYYFKSNGPMVLGWVQLDGKWYYLDPEKGGAMRTSWLTLGKKRYYLNENGVMQTGVFYLKDGEKGSSYAYQADDTGAIITNTTSTVGKTKMKYDERGRIKFRNAKTEENNKRYGSDVWQPLLSKSQLDEEADKDITVLREIQDDLWDSYKKNVKRAKKAEQPTALEEWKQEARYELANHMESGDIELFIEQVIAES